MNRPPIVPLSIRDLNKLTSRAAETMSAMGGYQPKNIDREWLHFMVAHMETFAAFGMAWTNKKAA
jgi:hypothetical protein